MKEHLQIWYDAWLAEHRKTDLIYANPENPQLKQVHFVRDHLSSVVWADVEHDKRPKASPPREDCRESAFVIGEHHSKSVRLPVYSIERPDLGIQFVARDNYHDWNVSVISEKPIETDLRGFKLDFSERDRERFPNGYPKGSGMSWDYCFFQGFPKELQFGPYSEDKRRFSMCVMSDHDLHTLVWLIMRDRRKARHDA